MMIDNTLSAMDNILQLVEEVNPAAMLTTTNVSLNTPSTYSGTENRNTQITVQAVPNQGYSGEQTVFYDRLPLNQVVNIPAFPVKVMAGDTPATVRERVCLVYGIVDQGLNWNAGRPLDLPTAELPYRTAIVRASAASLLYTANSQISIKYIAEEVSLTGDLGSILEDPTGWVEDPTNGWYNDTNPEDFEVALTLTASQLNALPYLERIEGIFTAYQDGPNGNLGDNIFFARDTNDTHYRIGTEDGDRLGESDMAVHAEGTHTLTQSNVIQQTLGVNIPSAQLINGLLVRSGYRVDTPSSTRGMKGFKLFFRSVI